MALASAAFVLNYLEQRPHSELYFTATYWIRLSLWYLLREHGPHSERAIAEKHAIATGIEISVLCITLILMPLVTYYLSVNLMTENMVRKADDHKKDPETLEAMIEHKSSGTPITTNETLVGRNEKVIGDKSSSQDRAETKEIRKTGDGIATGILYHLVSDGLCYSFVAWLGTSWISQILVFLAVNTFLAPLHALWTQNSLLKPGTALRRRDSFMATHHNGTLLVSSLVAAFARIATMYITMALVEHLQADWFSVLPLSGMPRNTVKLYLTSIVALAAAWLSRRGAGAAMTALRQRLIILFMKEAGMCIPFGMLVWQPFEILIMDWQSPSDTPQRLWTLLYTGIIGTAVHLLLIIPSATALTRVEASLLPEGTPVQVSRPSQEDEQSQHQSKLSKSARLLAWALISMNRETLTRVTLLYVAIAHLMLLFHVPVASEERHKGSALGKLWRLYKDYKS